MAAACLMSCKGDDPVIRPPLPAAPYTGLVGNKIVIKKIRKLPDGLHIDSLWAKIQGNRQKVVATATGYPDGNGFVMELPATFDEDQLIASQWNIGEFLSGFWPAVSSDPLAGVANLADIVAYDGESRVGRFYLSDWTGEGGSEGKAFIYYHYAEREFSLSGYNLNVYQSPGFQPSYFYSSAVFEPGWNAYANINPAGSGVVKCTTDIPGGLDLQWSFESWP